MNTKCNPLFRPSIPICPHYRIIVNYTLLLWTYCWSLLLISPIVFYLTSYHIPVEWYYTKPATLWYIRSKKSLIEPLKHGIMGIQHRKWYTNITHSPLSFLAKTPLMPWAPDKNLHGWPRHLQSPGPYGCPSERPPDQP